MKTVGFYTLGCRLNIFETDGIASQLNKLGMSPVKMDENPDIIVINTCTVTNKADSKNRNIIRAAIKNNPGSQIWVTGCYAETDKEIIEKIPGVTGVIGNKSKSMLPYIISQKNGLVTEKDIPETLDRFSYSNILPHNHTRAYLKIQDGCNRVCSYCKIPSARGKGVSRSWNDVLDQVRFLQDQGVGEIILTGVNIGWYRDSDGKKGFNRLLQSILDILEYSRLRISSIEPSDVGNELADIIGHPRFCKYLHIPLQSGSSRILKLMKRSYTAETFYKRVQLVLSKVPDIFLGTDVITGFPGETIEDFNSTKSLLSDLGFSKIHPFPFSVRKGTNAESLEDAITKTEKKERVIELTEISKQAYKKYGEAFYKKELEAILENDGTLLTDNYIKVKLEDPDILPKLKTGQFLSIVPNQYSEAEEIFYGSFLER